MDYEEMIFSNLTEIDGNPYLAEEITFLVFAIPGITANCFLIYLVCYYVKLHTTVNFYLVNWAIANIGVIFTVLYSFRMFGVLNKVSESLLDFFYEMEFALTIVVMLFMLLLSTDWCLLAYLPRLLDKFREYTRLIVACVWIHCVLYLLLAFSSKVISNHSSHVFMVIFGSLLVFIVALHLIRIIYKCRGRPRYVAVAPLLIPTAFVACWVLCWIHLLLLDMHKVYISAFWYTDIPLFLHPIVNFGLMVILDKNFKICFLQTLKRLTCGLFKPKVENLTVNGNTSEA